MRRAVLCVVGLLSAAVAGPVRAADVNLNLYPVSGRVLDKNLWDPVDTQYALGTTVDFGGPGWPVHFAVGQSISIGARDYSNPLINDTVGTVAELYVGVAKQWATRGRTRPFVGAGVSFVQARLEFDAPGGTVDDRDTSLGGWLEGGVSWHLGPHFRLGFHGRVLTGTKVTLFGVDGNADYWQAGPLVGWSWPPRR